MKIAHAAMYVADLERARAFFETYFGGQAGKKYHNPRTGFSSYFIAFEEGAKLELMHRAEIREAAGGNCLGYAHLSFSTGSREAVDALAGRLSAAGYRVADGPRTTGDGYYECVILDAEGNRIELTT